jgi:hypothetical protein
VACLYCAGGQRRRACRPVWQAVAAGTPCGGPCDGLQRSAAAGRATQGRTSVSARHAPPHAAQQARQDQVDLARARRRGKQLLLALVQMPRMVRAAQERGCGLRGRQGRWHAPLALAHILPAQCNEQAEVGLLEAVCGQLPESQSLLRSPSCYVTYARDAGLSTVRDAAAAVHYTIHKLVHTHSTS